MIRARTENDIFEAFKVLHPEDGLRWAEYWYDLWIEQIDEYTDLRWHVFPCGKYSKRPVAGWKWTEKKLAYPRMIWYAAQGYNLAAKMGDLVVFDCDTESVKPFDTKTLTLKTPKGYQYWCQGPVPNQDVSRTKLVELGFDKAMPYRTGNTYALVPLSRTCIFDKGGSCPCPNHFAKPGERSPIRYREWVNFGVDPLPFKRVLREMVS